MLGLKSLPLVGAFLNGQDPSRPVQFLQLETGGGFAPLHLDPANPPEPSDTLIGVEVAADHQLGAATAVFDRVAQALAGSDLHEVYPVIYHVLPAPVVVDGHWKPEA